MSRCWSEGESCVALQTRVSDLVCRDYRLFRGEVRILSGEAAGTDGKEPMPASAPPPANSPKR